jgi:CelD/BcsL family acetyltransferase involved in cellulose biosynthesis
MTTKTIMHNETVQRGAVRSRGERGRSAVASNRQGSIRRRVPLFIPSDQTYYWSSQWQRDEAETLANLKAGDYETFDNPSDAIRYLLADD